MLILSFFLIGPILLLCLLAYGLWRRASQSAKEAQGMALLAANLEGQLKQSENKADRMTEIAKHAINEAAKAAQLKPEDVWEPRIGIQIEDSDRSVFRDNKITYVPQIVAYCPSCNVSVRHDPSEYPVPCPACQTLIDPTFDSGIIDE